jgi:homoserine O-acetyltransferase
VSTAAVRRIEAFEEPLPLDSGAVLPRFDIAYELYGELDEERDNAILVCHGLTTGAHAAGEASGDQPAGWWNALIGPGKPLDTERYGILCANVIGGCDGSTGPASVAPESGRPYGLSFPLVTFGDSVCAHARLADRLGIDRFQAALGGCVGGFQAMEWMARYPQRLDAAIVISATPRTTAHNLALWEVMRQAIMRDPQFHDGDYYDREGPLTGLGLASMVGMLVWMSRDVMSEKFGLRLLDGDEPRYTHEAEFELQAFMRGIADNADNRFDANSLIYLTKAMDYFDLTRGRSDLAEVFSGWQGRTLLISYASDWRYPAAEMDEIRVALEQAGAPVEHRTLDSDFGHGAFVYDTEGAVEEIRRFLAAAPALAG